MGVSSTTLSGAGFPICKWTREPGLQEERFDPVRVNHVLARRPGEDGEAAILRGDEGDGIMLIADELSGGEMAGASQLGGVDNFGLGAFDGLGEPHLGE